MIVLITGPVRSGKSARALAVARALGRPLTYVATARLDPSDVEMVDRVVRHRKERGAMAAIELWQPGIPDLAAIVDAAAGGTTLLVDSLGTWLAGHLLDLETVAASDPLAAERALAAYADPLLDSLARARPDVVIVAEEAGWGLVPPSFLGRLFRDQLGRIVQRIARSADRVELVVAGYAVDLKLVGRPVSE